MKKDFNKATLTDMPLDSSLPATNTEKTTPAKRKISQITSKNSKTKSKSKITTKNNEIKQKNEAIEEDLEKLNEENLKNHSFRQRRNRIVIIVLILLLILSIGGFILYFNISKLENNCYFHLEGDADAVYIINDMELTKFRAPSELKGNRILELKIQIKIKSGGNYNIKFKPRVYQSGSELSNVLIYEPIQNEEYKFVEAEGGFYNSYAPISGNQTITLCYGVVLDRDYENSLNISNFKMDFYTYLYRV